MPLATVFSEDGTVSGSSGCNSYQGAYRVDGSSIVIGPLASTLRACGEPGVMPQEQAFLAALASSRSYTVTGELMQLRDGPAWTPCT